MKRTYNINKLYENYKKQFFKTKTRLEKKGFDIAVTNPQMASLEEFTNQIELFNLERIGKKTGYTNKVRQLATGKFYARSIEEAKKLEDVLNSFGIYEINGKKLTIEDLRVYGLGDLNKALKKAGYDSSYDRASYISYFVYDSD